MQINSITPISFQTNRGSSKTTAPSFGQAELSDTEKLAKALEALGNIGNALTKIGADTQAAVASLKETNTVNQKEIPATANKNTDEAVDMDKKIISMSPAINKMTHNIKYEYLAGKGILKEANAILDEFNRIDVIRGNKFEILGYPYKAWNEEDGVHIASDFIAEVDDYGVPTTPRDIEIIYKDNEDGTGLKYIAKSERYTVFPYTDEGSLHITRTLHDNTKETYDFYNDGNVFEYEKRDMETNKVITSLSKYINNTIVYTDKDKAPEGLKLKINKYSEAVQYKKANPADGEENNYKTAYVDDETVNLLLDVTSGIYGK